MVSIGAALYGQRWMRPLARGLRWPSSTLQTTQFGQISTWRRVINATPGWIADACLELVREHLAGMEAGHSERAALVELADAIQACTLRVA